MPEREDGAPFIARCTYQQPYRGGAWQCRLTDPHEGIDHDLPIDAEFGRDLDEQDPLWLAAKLRDERARNRHLEAKVRRARLLAIQLADEETQRARVAGATPCCDAGARLLGTLDGPHD